jgi:hypothetical protein
MLTDGEIAPRPKRSADAGAIAAAGELRAPARGQASGPGHRVHLSSAVP